MVETIGQMSVSGERSVIRAASVAPAQAVAAPVQTQPQAPAQPAVTVLVRGLRLVRIYGPGRRWNQPRSYGPLADTRFDHHRPPLGTDPDRSVWYASRALLGAIGA